MVIRKGFLTREGRGRTSIAATSKLVTARDSALSSNRHRLCRQHYRLYHHCFFHRRSAMSSVIFAHRAALRAFLPPSFHCNAVAATATSVKHTKGRKGRTQTDLPQSSGPPPDEAEDELEAVVELRLEVSEGPRHPHDCREGELHELPADLPSNCRACTLHRRCRHSAAAAVTGAVTATAAVAAAAAAAAWFETDERMESEPEHPSDEEGDDAFLSLLISKGSLSSPPSPPRRKMYAGAAT